MQLYRRKMEELRNTNFCIIFSFLPKIIANLIDSNEDILYRRKMEELRNTNFRLISSLHPKIVANLIYLNKNLYIYEIK